MRITCEVDVIGELLRAETFSPSLTLIVLTLIASIVRKEALQQKEIDTTLHRVLVKVFSNHLIRYLAYYHT